MVFRSQLELSDVGHVQLLPSAWPAAVGIDIEHLGAPRERDGIAPYRIRCQLITMRSVVVHRNGVRTEIAEARVRADEVNRVWDADVAGVYAEHDVDEVILGVGRWPGLEAKSGFELVLDSLPLAANDGVPIDERDMVLVRDRLQHVQIESVLPQFVVQKDHVRAVAARQPDHLPDVLAIIAEPDASPLIE